MSEPIKVGDLVVVVRGHVCDLGIVFAVARVETTTDYWHCAACGYVGDVTTETWAFLGKGVDGSPLSWLRRIPPLAELGEVEHDESIPA
jgi:hypothetical protein